MTSKAMRAALGDLHREPMLEPHQIPVQTILWRILVQPLPPLKRNAGGVIELPDEVQNAEGILTSIGRVLQLGHFAFKSTTQAGLALAEEPFKPQVGNFVLHETYAGQEIKLRDGKKLRILLDTEVLAVVKDPDEIRNYI
jgi:co-chaperonin GroES (HSP10)